jgi:hypothetical protein
VSAFALVVALVAGAPAPAAAVERRGVARVHDGDTL